MNAIRAVGALAGAIVGLAKLADLITGVDLLPTWREAVFLYSTVFNVLTTAIIVLDFWLTGVWRRSWRAVIISGVLVGNAAVSIQTTVGVLAAQEDQPLNVSWAVFVTLLPVLTLWMQRAAAVRVWRRFTKTKCPLCKEKIHRQAVRCKHCHGSLVPPAPLPVPEPVQEPRVLLHVALPMRVVIRLERAQRPKGR